MRATSAQLMLPIPEPVIAISSPASAVGLGHSSSPVGQTTEKCGPALVRASRLAGRAKKVVQPTTGTCGRIGSGSLASADLQRCLVSRLCKRLGTNGSTPWPMIWKASATPLGRPLSRLALLGRRICGNDYGLWPTPHENCWTGDGWSGPGRGRNLQTAVRAGRRALPFATPTARDWRTGKASAATHAKKNPRPLSEQIGGNLNPAWVAWLMGYPAEWLSCAGSAMRLSHKLRQRS